MECELCGIHTSQIYSVPRHQASGRLFSFLCRDCALAESYLCEIHDQIHQGFADGSHACLVCIEAKVAKHRAIAYDVDRHLRKKLPRAVYEEPHAAAEMAGVIKHCPPEISILRFFVTRAERLKLDLELVINETIRLQSVDVLLGNDSLMSLDTPD